VVCALQDGLGPAWMLFQRMKAPASGVKPNTITYNLLMNGSLTHDQPHRVRAGRSRSGCAVRVRVEMSQPVWCHAH